MVIIKPTLPPKKGYVEVEVCGKRTYQNIETGILIEDEIPQRTFDERITELETALAESDAVAMALYEANLAQEAINTEQDEAILGLYEMMGG